MSDAPEEAHGETPREELERDPRTGLFKAPKSFGGRVDETHWSRSRGDRNDEALDYYRERSKAPGVAEGGGPRNFYCMQCDGVVPHDHAQPTCPHCAAPLEDKVKRYFNWVEIDKPPEGDARAMLLLIGIALAALIAFTGLVWWLL